MDEVGRRILVQLLVFLSAFCGAGVETLIKKIVTLTGSPAMAPIHPLSVGVAAVAALDFFILATIFNKGHGLVEVGVLQVVYYYIALIFFGRLVYGEDISMIKCTGMALSVLAIMLMTWDQWSWSK